MFERCFRQWVACLVGVAKGVVAFDGKTVKGSKDGPNTALHRVSAYATARAYHWDRKAVQAKAAAIKALLDTLVLKGGAVTLDALGCQIEVAEKIVARGGDYVLALNDNQNKLSEAVVEFFDSAETFALGFAH